TAPPRCVEAVIERASGPYPDRGRVRAIPTSSAWLAFARHSVLVAGNSQVRSVHKALPGGTRRATATSRRQSESGGSLSSVVPTRHAWPSAVVGFGTLVAANPPVRS